MITDPFGVVTALLVIEGGIFYLAEYGPTKRFFNVLPPMFWIYFLPMVATTLGVIPQQSEVYPFISRHLLPVSLVMLLLSVDIRAILRLGKIALAMLLVGSAGIVLGGPTVLLLFQPWLPADIWLGFGALSGSWIGGSANMVAVQQGIGTPEEILAPIIVVDTIVAYSWMGLLIALAKFQSLYDRWNRSNTQVMEELNRKLSSSEKTRTSALTLKHAVVIFAVGFAGAWVAAWMGAALPEVRNLVSTYTWTILIVTALGVGLSFTPVRRLEPFGASKLGYGLLYLVLAAIGARANLADMMSVPILVVAGFTWVAIHALLLLAASRLLRAPMFLMVTASQANIGGPASAPVVAGVYQPALVTVGLLMAIVGGILGTYLGIVCSQLCRMVSQL
ncbi:MAG: DUF819 family protein [Phycisphaerae bacterium]|nr:DUF819 family protein [Phycisphaerae bacterium]